MKVEQMLLEFTEIQVQLEQLFSPLEPMLSGFRLLPSPVSLFDVTQFESLLGEVLDVAFKDILLRFQLGNFTLGPIAFSSSSNYLSWLMEYNQGVEPKHFPVWWGEGMRPKKMLLVAVSDPFNILLNNETGNIYAFKDDVAWNQNLIRIAHDFPQFLRGAGTVFLLRCPKADNADLADRVATEVGARDAGTSFWRWLAE